MRALLIAVLLSGCQVAEDVPVEGCAPDLLENEGAIDVGEFALERDYQRIEATHTDDVDRYRYSITRSGRHHVRAMAGPIWSSLVSVYVRCPGMTHCGGGSGTTGHVFDGACMTQAVDLSTVIVSCDGEAELIVDVARLNGGQEVCGYTLDVAVTP